MSAMTWIKQYIRAVNLNSRSVEYIFLDLFVSAMLFIFDTNIGGQIFI